MHKRFTLESGQLVEGGCGPLRVDVYANPDGHHDADDYQDPQTVYPADGYSEQRGRKTTTYSATTLNAHLDGAANLAGPFLIYADWNIYNFQINRPEIKI